MELEACGAARSPQASPGVIETGVSWDGPEADHFLSGCSQGGPAPLERVAVRDLWEVCFEGRGWELPQHVLLLLIWPAMIDLLAGRNEKGQLGHGDTKRVEAPRLIEALSHEAIVLAACGRNHTLALTGKKAALSVLTEAQRLQRWFVWKRVPQPVSAR